MDSEPTSQETSDKLNQWPPAEGRYVVGNKDSPVAVCTMASVDIKLPMDKVAIIGKCVTENLGIEKIVKNVVTNPSIKYIIVAGRESMGHFVDNALESLVEKGTDDEGRILGAKGGIPVLKNTTKEEVERFRKQVEIVNMAGEMDVNKIMEKVNQYFDKPSQSVQPPQEGAQAMVSSEPQKIAAQVHPISNWTQDPKGYFTIQVSQANNEIVVNQHDTSGKILGVHTGKSAEDLYHHMIDKDMLSRLDHAAYLGRELAKAETALFNKADYEQDTGLVLPVQASQPQVFQPQTQSTQIQSNEVKVDTDGKEIVPLPTHGKLISVKKIEQTKETVLTYVVNDREFPVRGVKKADEDQFKEFLRGCGMHRVF